MNKKLNYKIKKEISEFCKTCPSSCECPEEECVLFRIEKLILKGEKENESKSNKIQRKCETTT